MSITAIITNPVELVASFKQQAVQQQYLVNDDMVHFAHSKVADVEIRARILMERHIIRHFVASVLCRSDAVYSISINDGEEWPVKLSRDIALIMEHIGACDEEWLYVRKGVEPNVTKVGMLYLVYGNGGWDVICDSTATDAFEDLLKDTNDLVDALGEL